MRLSRLPLAAALTGILVSGCLSLQPLPNSVRQQLEDATKESLDGLIVSIDRKGRPPELWSAGWKNRDTHEPADPHALFKIASISKLYIAAAVAKLVAAGKLSLDRTLAAELPEVSDHIKNAEKITLRMLVQHRSGIPDFINDPGFPWSNLPADLDGYLAFALDKPADFQPGTSYRYSNTNYLLIGMILDQALGYPHGRYIKAEILDRLGLVHTFYTLDEVDLADMASGYYVGYNGDLRTQYYSSPGGSMVATAEDVGVFLRALNEGTLLSPDEQAIYSSIYVYQHTGLLPGYSSLARYSKELDTVVVLFVSTSGGNTWWDSEVLFDRVWQIVRKQKVAEGHSRP